MWINCKSNWLEVGFQQLSSASFSTQKSDHGGISLSLLSHVDETPFFFSSPSLLHQTLYPGLLYFSCCTLFTRPGTTAKGKRKKRKKKKARPKANCHDIRNARERVLFLRPIRPQTASRLVSAAMAKWWWWCTLSPCMDEPSYIHTVFRNVKFQEFSLSMCKLHFLKAYNLARFEHFSFSQKQQKAHPPTKNTLSNLNSLTQLGGGSKVGWCHHFSKKR